MPNENLLFPSDAAPTTAPDWYRARSAEAQQRLSGRHDRPSVQANVLFPTDAPKGQAPAPQRPAAPQAKPNDPTAANLFPTEGEKPQRMSDKGFEDLKPYDAKAVTSYIEGFAGSAIAEGDTARADELQAAGAALTQDFAKAGTDPADLTEAFAIVKERHADTAFGPVSEEKLVADYNATMSNLAEEGVSISDIEAARAFIADLELVAPGTVRTLEATGAGNDARLIRKAIAEAKRRGY